MFKCEHCGKTFGTEKECLTHEKREKDILEANKMLHEGKTLGEINAKIQIWYELPVYLEEVTEDSCFKVSYWQCCEKPAYQVKKISLNGDLYLEGIGSWEGYYGGYVKISDGHLKHPYPKDKLYIHY